VSQSSQIDFRETLQVRVSDRIAEQGLFTFAEAGAVELWCDYPVMAVVGAGMGGSASFVRLYRDDYYGYVAAPRGVVGFVADLGLCGLVLFLAPFLDNLRQLARHVRLRRREWANVAAVVIFSAHVTVLIMTYAHWYMLFAVIGLVSGTAAGLAERAPSIDRGVERKGHVKTVLVGVPR